MSSVNRSNSAADSSLGNVPRMQRQGGSRGVGNPYSRVMGSGLSNGEFANMVENFFRYRGPGSRHIKQRVVVDLTQEDQGIDDLRRELEVTLKTYLTSVTGLIKTNYNIGSIGRVPIDLPPYGNKFIDLAEKVVSYVQRVDYMGSLKGVTQQQLKDPYTTSRSLSARRSAIALVHIDMKALMPKQMLEYQLHDFLSGLRGYILGTQRHSRDFSQYPVKRFNEVVEVLDCSRLKISVS